MPTRTPFRSNLDEYALYFVAETDKGLGVRQGSGQQFPTFWLPKSQVEYDEKAYKRGDVVRVTMPEWLAERNDLT